jgi:hypothetical protein
MPRNPFPPTDQACKASVQFYCIVESSRYTHSHTASYIQQRGRLRDWVFACLVYRETAQLQLSDVRFSTDDSHAYFSTGVAKLDVFIVLTLVAPSLAPQRNMVHLR